MSLLKKIMDDTSWNKIKAGDKQAFRLIFDEYYSPLCLYANSFINDLDTAEDIVSDFFIKICEKRESIEIKFSVKQYFLFSVKNSVYSYLRSAANKITDIEPILKKIDNTPLEEYDLEKEEVLLQVDKLIEKLPEQRRKILKLSVFERKSYMEISDILGISVNTVNTQISRAYKFLRDNLDDYHLFLLFMYKKSK